MKILKYNLCTKVNNGTEEEPQIEEILSPVIMGWNEANEEIAKREAYNGEYTVEDDGEEEPAAEPSLEDRVGSLETNTADLAEALDQILSSGVV